MAQVNTNYQIPTYTNDFGQTLTNLPIRVEGKVPATLLEALGYTIRENDVACTIKSKRRKLRPRYITATFADGSKNRFIYGGVTPAALTAFASVLVNTGGAICLELEGEKYGVLTSAQYGSATVNYKNSPYTDIPAGKVYTKVQYSYTSDALSTALSLSVRIESNPSELYKCQTAGLTSPTVVTGETVCSGSGLGIKPRHFIIQALSHVSAGIGVTTTSKVTREANVSHLNALQGVITNVAPCAYCLGYKGETIKHLENVITISPGA